MKCNKIVCVDHKPDPLKEKIFLGDYGKFLRVDKVSHPVAKNLKEFSEGNTWFAKEISYKKDIIGWQTLPDVPRRIFKLNITYQSLMDSGVASGFGIVMMQIITSSIWALTYQRISGEEAIHAESYSYALDTIFGDEAEKILDLVYEDPFIKSRLKGEVEGFEEVKRIIIDGGDTTSDEAKKAILRMLLRTLALESIKFPLSFLVTWLINDNYNSAIQGISRLLKLIAHDELNFHVPTGKNVLNILRKEKRQGFKHLFDNGWFDNEAKMIIEETVQTEIEWAEYLLSEGDIAGFNIDIAENFIKYRANETSNLIKVDEIYPNIKEDDTITFFNDNRDIDKQNVAGQEGENSSYQKGILMNNLDEGFTQEQLNLLIVKPRKIENGQLNEQQFKSLGFAENVSVIQKQTIENEKMEDK